MLRKNYIIIITAISGVALIGLILIQFYWVNEAIRQGKKELKSKISQSLTDITEEVGKHEMQNAIYQKDPYKILNKINKKMNVEIGYDSLSQTYFYKNLSTNLNAQNQLMSLIMEEVMSAGKPLNLEERISEQTLDSVVKKVLHDNGVEAEYEFVVVNDTGAVIYGDSLQSETFMNSEYNINLFPMDLFGPNYFLALSVPDEIKIVIESMWMMLGISAMFVIIIIYAFYTSISTIVKQKKVSIIKNDFINNMTHELKTPISTISLACEALGDQILGSNVESRERYINMINEENKRLGTLVENVLQSSVLDRGDIKLKIEELNINDILHKAVKNIKIQVQKRNGNINLELKAKNIIVNGDRVHITNVFYNLLDNAQKYAKDSPLITINTVDVVGGVMVKINDNGIGIAKEHQHRIFEKLYRVPTGDRHDVKGFGLGLSYVKSIIESHNGEISVESSIGKGSTFTIILPINKNMKNE